MAGVVASLRGWSVNMLETILKLKLLCFRLIQTLWRLLSFTLTRNYLFLRLEFLLDFFFLTNIVNILYVCTFSKGKQRCYLTAIHFKGVVGCVVA